MTAICSFIKRALSCPLFVYGSLAATCFIALAAALTAEAVFLLEPCPLCIYQRIPFAIGLVLGLIGVLKRKSWGISTILTAVLSLNFFINSAIALYHSGVELHWWESALEGCTVPESFFTDTSDQSMLENIFSAPTARCDQIPWADPFFDLSMANYNVMLCAGMAIFCLLVIAVKRCPIK